MKAWKFLGAPLMFMLLTGMPWSQASAENDVTEPVKVEAGQHSTIVDDVNVENNDYAVKVIADQEGEGKDSSATIKANVTLTDSREEGEDESIAIYATGSKNSASAAVNGDVAATGARTMYGAVAEGNYIDNAGTADVIINGDVNVKSQNETATGIELRHGEQITIKENVTAEGKTYAEGVHAYTNKESKVTINGGVIANGADASGVRLETFGNTNNLLTLTIGEGGITANSTANEESGGSAGMTLTNFGGTISADITGDVVAKSPIANACGIKVDGTVVEGNISPGESNIIIHGNLISDGVGIANIATGIPTVTTNILVENEIRSNAVGVLSKAQPIIFIPSDGDDIPGNNTYDLVTNKLNLTVWKIQPNQEGNVAEYYLNRWQFPDGILPEGIETHGRDKEMEKKIMYIIKVEQPNEGCTIKAVDANGNALEKSFGFDVAHEGDKILLKASLKDGYKIIAAYNGLGEKVPLLKDGDGNYYIIVPKGGGVYLSVELEYTNEHHYAKPDKNEETISGDSNDDVKEESAKSSKKENLSYKASVNSDAPKTGDNDKATPWLLLSLISIGGIAGMEILGKKGKKEVNL